jgi:hypothetical protein
MSAVGKSIMTRYGIAWSIWCCLVIGLGSLINCKAEEPIKDPEAVIKAHAETYWTKRLMERDLRAAYEMEEEKGTLSFSDYEQRVRNAGQIDYLSLRADEVRLNGDQATVKLTVRYRVKDVPKQEMEWQIQDAWVIRGNQVKHLLGGRPKPKSSQ